MLRPRPRMNQTKSQHGADTQTKRGSTEDMCVTLGVTFDIENGKCLPNNLLSCLFDSCRDLKVIFIIPKPDEPEPNRGYDGILTNESGDDHVGEWMGGKVRSEPAGSSVLF